LFFFSYFFFPAVLFSFIHLYILSFIHSLFLSFFYFLSSSRYFFIIFILLLRPFLFLFPSLFNYVVILLPFITAISSFCFLVFSFFPAVEVCKFTYWFDDISKSYLE
jgi:hypothetical protein